MKITYLAAASLDGFIAREDGDVSWLDDMNISADDTGLEEFFASIDGLVMGRSTYNFVFDHGSWPYEDKPTWVCTQTEVKPLDGAILMIVNNVDDVVTEAELKGLNHLWLVGGGKLASSFLDKGLLTNLTISEMPIKLGSGIPLFAAHKLEQFSSEQQTVIQKNGFKQLEVDLRA
jgi:dihydrofolate reductase